MYRNPYLPAGSPQGFNLTNPERRLFLSPAQPATTGQPMTLGQLLRSGAFYSGAVGRLGQNREALPPGLPRGIRSRTPLANPTLSQFYDLLSDPGLWSGMRSALAVRRHMHGPGGYANPVDPLAAGPVGGRWP